MQNRSFYLLFACLGLAWAWAGHAQEALVPVEAANPAAAEVPVEIEVQPKGTGKLYQLYAEDIEKTVGEALVADGAGEKVAATVVGRRTLPLYESDKSLDVQVKTLRHDAQTQKWSANLLFTNADGKVESAMPVSGRYQEMVSLPVLKRRVDASETIADSDIESKEYPLSRTRKDVVLDKAKLIGKSPRRTISQGRPVREDELTGATLLVKDTLVRMRFEANGIVVETTGQALDSGAKGDLVRVRNMDSKAIVQGVVEEKNLVKMQTGGQVSEPVAPKPAANTTEAAKTANQ